MKFFKHNDDPNQGRLSFNCRGRTTPPIRSLPTPTPSQSSTSAELPQPIRVVQLQQPTPIRTSDRWPIDYMDYIRTPIREPYVGITRKPLSDDELREINAVTYLERKLLVMRDLEDQMIRQKKAGTWDRSKYSGPEYNEDLNGMYGVFGLRDRWGSIEPKDITTWEDLEAWKRRGVTP